MYLLELLKSCVGENEQLRSRIGTLNKANQGAVQNAYFVVLAALRIDSFSGNSSDLLDSSFVLPEACVVVVRV